MTAPESDPAVVAAHRERVWAELRKVARPDSRFHWDFSSFIPDFVGSDDAAVRVRELDAYRRGGLLFITPDNSTEALRRQVVLDRRPFIMTTYGIGRGFLHLDPSTIDPADARYAATLDGMDRYATPVTLAEIRRMPPIDLLVTGGSAVSTNGVRFGKGHGYFDLEWAMLSEVGAAGAASEVADVVHECQVVDDVLVGDAHDVPVDWIITPSETRAVDVDRAPGHVFWELLDGSPLRDIPPIQELLATRPATASA
jgi:5-formyltetrahydrofolate cyclo-ligase